jgi:molecular chaperone GrpE
MVVSQQTEKDALADSVRSDVVQQLLPLIDNFELARTQVEMTVWGPARVVWGFQLVTIESVVT